MAHNEYIYENIVIHHSIFDLLYFMLQNELQNLTLKFVVQELKKNVTYNIESEI